MLEERCPAVVIKRIAICRVHHASIGRTVADADRKEAGAGRDGRGNERVLEGLHRFAVRGRAFREQRDRGPLGEYLRDLLDLPLQPRGAPALHKEAPAAPREQAEREGLLELHGRDEHRGHEGGNDEDVHVREMVRYDEVVRSALPDAISLQTVRVDPDAQHPETEVREERGIAREPRLPACAARRQSHDSERDQRVQRKEQKDGNGFKEYSHEGDAINYLLGTKLMLLLFEYDKSCSCTKEQSRYMSRIASPHYV